MYSFLLTQESTGHLNPELTSLHKPKSPVLTLLFCGAQYVSMIPSCLEPPELN